MDWVVLVTALAWVAFMAGVPYALQRQEQDRTENAHWEWQYTKPRSIPWDSWAHQHLHRRQHAEATR